VKAEFQQEVAEVAEAGISGQRKTESVTWSNGFFQRRGQKLGIVRAAPLKNNVVRDGPPRVATFE